MLLHPGDVLSLSFGSQQDRVHSSVVHKDPGVASQIVIELCIIMHDVFPRPLSKQTRHLVHRIAGKSQEIFRRLFEVKFLSAINVLPGLALWSFITWLVLCPTQPIFAWLPHL